MQIITKYYLLNANDLRVEELTAPATGAGERFETVRVLVRQDGQGNSYETETHSVKQYGIEPEVADNRAIYTLQNESVSINGQPATQFAGNYYCEPDDTIQLQGEIVENGVIVESIDIPVTLKMPMIRHANGKPTQEEVYLNVTLQNGVLNATGKIPWSGDWKIIIERNNEAIQRIGADWKLQHSDITFLA